MKLFFASACAAGCLMITSAAFAQGGDEWNLDKRESWLQTTADRGAADGSLSGQESARIRDKVNHIHDEQMRLTAENGHLTDADMQRLEGELDKTVGRIHWMKAEHATRPW